VRDALALAVVGVVRIAAAGVRRARADGGRELAAVLEVVGLGALGDALHLLLVLGPLGLLHVPHERRDGDGGEDADDRHDDHELDEGETALTFDVLATHGVPTPFGDHSPRFWTTVSSLSDRVK